MPEKDVTDNGGTPPAGSEPADAAAAASAASAEGQQQPTPPPPSPQDRWQQEFVARAFARGQLERRGSAALVAAMAEPMKQFILWDVSREVLEPARPRTERVEMATVLLRAGRPPLPRLEPVCSREVASFVPASHIARRAHKGLRAALRLLLRQPLQP